MHANARQPPYTNIERRRTTHEINAVGTQWSPLLKNMPSSPHRLYLLQSKCPALPVVSSKSQAIPAKKNKNNIQEAQLQTQPITTHLILHYHNYAIERETRKIRATKCTAYSIDKSTIINLEPLSRYFLYSSIHQNRSPSNNLSFFSDITLNPTSMHKNPHHKNHLQKPKIIPQSHLQIIRSSPSSPHFPASQCAFNFPLFFNTYHVPPAFSRIHIPRNAKTRTSMHDMSLPPRSKPPQPISRVRFLIVNRPCPFLLIDSSGLPLIY